MSANSESSTSSRLLPWNCEGFSIGMPFSSLSVYVPCRSGSPHAVFAGTNADALPRDGGVGLCAASVTAAAMTNVNASAFIVLLFAPHSVARRTRPERRRRVRYHQPDREGFTSSFAGDARVESLLERFQSGPCRFDTGYI